MTVSRILLLNGAGSAGKTSIAKALQAITREPYLHVAMDAFLDMLPEVYQDHAESFRYEMLTEGGRAGGGDPRGRITRRELLYCSLPYRVTPWPRNSDPAHGKFLSGRQPSLFRRLFYLS